MVSYWNVATNPSGVLDTASNCYVPFTNGAYINWLGAGNEPGNIANEADLWLLLSPQYPGWLFNGSTFSQPSPGEYTKVQLLAYSAQARFIKEIGGLAINTNLIVSTDLSSQSTIIGAYTFATANPDVTIQWKGADSIFVPLTSSEIIELATAVGFFVQACFAAEAVVAAAIASSSITTLAQIDAEYAAI